MSCIECNLLDALVRVRIQSLDLPLERDLIMQKKLNSRLIVAEIREVISDLNHGMKVRASNGEGSEELDEYLAICLIGDLIEGDSSDSLLRDYRSSKRRRKLRRTGQSMRAQV